MKRETKHTPGPWHVGERRADDNTLPISDLGNGAKGSALAYVSPRPFYADSQEANARLIAAAPEMLECLRKCVEFLEDEIGASACLEKTRSILAKIEGR